MSCLCLQRRGHHATGAAIHKTHLLGNIDKLWESLNSTDKNQAQNLLLQVMLYISGSEHFVSL
jgi:hypothetical protein